VRIATEAEPGQLLGRTLELVEVELPAREQLHDVTGSRLQLAQRSLHRIGGCRIVGTDVWRRCEDKGPAGGGGLADRDRFVHVFGPVVEPRQHMRVEIDHGAVSVSTRRSLNSSAWRSRDKTAQFGSTTTM
jgi:hypothetical protein